MSAVETGPFPMTPPKVRRIQTKNGVIEFEQGLGRKLRAELERDEYGDPLLKPLLVKSLVKLIADGCTLENAARVCGLRRTVLEKWLVKGRKDVDCDPPVGSDEGSLARELDSALGDQEYELSCIVMAQAHEDPRLALETLARRRPKDWAPAVPEPTDLKKQYAGMNLKDTQAEVRRLMGALDPK